MVWRIITTLACAALVTGFWRVCGFLSSLTPGNGVEFIVVFLLVAIAFEVNDIIAGLSKIQEQLGKLCGAKKEGGDEW